MTETTYFLENSTLDQETFAFLMRSLFQSDPSTQSFLLGQLNSLIPTTPGFEVLRMDSGQALVHGTFYENTVAIDFSVPKGAATRIYILALDKVWATKNVRAVIVGPYASYAAYTAEPSY